MSVAIIFDPEVKNLEVSVLTVIRLPKNGQRFFAFWSIFSAESLNTVVNSL